MNKTRSNSINLLNDLWGVLTFLLHRTHFYETALNPLYANVICTYTILISQLFCMYMFIKTGSHTQASLSPLLLVWIRQFKSVQWNLSFPTTGVAKAGLCSSLQTHVIVYRIWNPFHQFPGDPKVKLVFILSNWNCSWYLHNEKESKTCCLVSLLNKQQIWQVSQLAGDQEPLHQAALTGTRAEASSKHSQPGSTPGSWPRETGVSRSHLNQLRPTGDRPTCIRHHLVSFICFQPHRHKNPLEFFLLKRFYH